MVLQVFFDDSGNAPDQDVLVVGGLLSDADRWALFTREWGAALQATHTTSKIDFVKYSEITRGKGQFDDNRGWDDASRAAHLSKLVDIVNNHAMASLAVAVRHSDFNKYIRDVPFGGRFVINDAPYAWMLERTVGPTIEFLASRGLTETCDFCFDTSPGADAWVQELWPGIQRIIPSLADDEVPFGVRPTIGSVSFKSETELLPLQGADIIAGAIRDRLTGRTLHPSLMGLDKIPNISKLMSVEELEESGRTLRRRAQRFRFRHPNAELVGYDPATAKRTRKMHERKRKRATSPHARPRVGPRKPRPKGTSS